MTTQQIRWMDSADIMALTNDQIAALTTAQAAALTTAQIVALTDDQIGALEVQDISAMSMTQVAAFSTDDYALMSGAQQAALNAVSPIILDLDRNGVSTLSAAEGVQFDLTGTGHTGQYGWVAQGDALLVRDINGDWAINDGRELFGAATQLADGSRAGNGYVALGALDSNSDGRIDGMDAAFGELKLWVDADSDGVTDIGELRGLVETGISSLSLGHVASDRMDNGNAVALVGSYETSDGATHEMADVWFAKARSEMPPPQIGDLLVDAPADLSVHAAAAAPTPSANAADAGSGTALSHGQVAKLNPFEEELLKNQPLI